jgi:hypothetical protein
MNNVYDGKPDGRQSDDDHELRKHALEIARGQPHKLVSQIIEDAKRVYHFLTTKEPLHDEMPMKNDEPPAPEPIKQYGALPAGGDVDERPAASDDNNPSPSAMEP